MPRKRSWRTSVAGTYIARFLTNNFVFALLPLIISWFVRFLGEIEAAIGAYTAEVLFFGVMISITALVDLADEGVMMDDDWVIQGLKGSLFSGAVIMAAMFGLFQYDLVIGFESSVLRSNIATYAFVIAGVLFVASLFAEISIAIIRGKAYIERQEYG